MGLLEVHLSLPTGICLKKVANNYFITVFKRFQVIWSVKHYDRDHISSVEAKFEIVQIDYLQKQNITSIWALKRRECLLPI